MVQIVLNTDDLGASASINTAIMWAYNAVSLRQPQLLALHRTES